MSSTLASYEGVKFSGK